MHYRTSPEHQRAAPVARPPRAPAGRPRAGAWAGYTAAAWAFLFSALNFYYAAGGTAGAGTWPPAIAAGVLRRDPAWIAVMWGTGALKVAAGLLALALAHPLGRRLPRRPLLAAAWTAVAIMGGYEGRRALVQHALMAAGVLATPAGLGATALRWRLVLWDPYWLLGGILFAAAALRYRRLTRAG